MKRDNNKMRYFDFQKSILVIWLVVFAVFGGKLQNCLAQEHKDPKHPQTNHENPGKRKDTASENNRQDDSVIFKVKVRGWNPDRKEESRIHNPTPVQSDIVGDTVSLINAKRRETDPAPFPVRGKVEIYIEIAQLAIAINGIPALNSGLEIESHNLRATLKNYVPKKRDEDVTFKIKREGLISSRVQTLNFEDGESRLYVPLEDVVKAFGGRIKVKLPWLSGPDPVSFSITIDQKCVTCLLEYVPPDGTNRVNN